MVNHFNKSLSISTFHIFKIKNYIIKCRQIENDIDRINNYKGSFGKLELTCNFQYKFTNKIN